MSSGGISSNGKVYCNHGEEAAKRKSNTSKHPNREFYCCKRRQSDTTRCDFWYWADKLPRAKDSIVHETSNSLATPSPVPRPSKDGDSRTRPAPAPATRPSPMHFSPSNNPSETPQSRNRLEDIEAGLRQREQDLSPTRHPGPSKERGRSTSLSGVQTVPQPPSPVPTEIDCEVEPQPRKTFSFLGLEYSPEPVTSTIQQEGQPSTPKKRRLTPPTEGSVAQPTANPVSFGGELPLTPPQTTRYVAQFDGPGPASAIIHSRKGKEREVVPQVPTQDQDSVGKPQEEDSLPLFTLPEDTSSTSSRSPTVAENVLDYTDGMRTRVKALSEYIDSFDITQAVKLLQKMERQKIQYECRDRSQKTRMQELIAEKDKLIAEVSGLKEALQRSEESNRVKDAEIAGLKGLTLE